MIRAGSRYIFASLIFLALAAFQINSTVWFRERLAAFYNANGRYAEAVRIYNKILRKDSVKKHLPGELVAQTRFNLAGLYSELGLKNLAIESYAKGCMEYPDIDIGVYRDGSDMDKDRLLAVGLLEGGRLEEAIGEFQRMKERYPDFQSAERYIAAARDLEKAGSKRDENSYFTIGDGYIENQLFEEARAFYTKRILDYGVGPLVVLEYLDMKYTDAGGIREKVWDNDIYVMLEDFETIEPQLSVWIGHLKSKVSHHCITDKDAYEGRYSEYLDIVYYTKGHELWQKSVRVPLHSAKLKLGVRLSMKSADPSAHALFFNIVFPKEKTTGTFQDFNIKDAEGGWQEYASGDIVARAKEIASMYHRNTEDMFMDKVLLDTRGLSNKFYIDRVELYLIR